MPTQEARSQVVRSPTSAARAKCRMILWLLLFYLVTLLWAYLTFPFLGYHSPSQNVLHGILVACPFWTAAFAAIVKTHRQSRLRVPLRAGGRPGPGEAREDP